MSAMAQNKVRRIAAALICLSGSVLLVNALLAQPTQKTSPRVEAPPNDVAVVPLKHAMAVEVYHALGNIFASLVGANATIGVDQRTNAVIAAAPPGKIAEIRELIAKLDVPATAVKATGSDVRVFS